MSEQAARGTTRRNDFLRDGGVCPECGGVIVCDRLGWMCLALRPAVRRFALTMEARLRANDHKGGWEDERLQYLTGRMREEFLELEREVYPGFGKTPDVDRVRREAADVANFALMIADVVGALSETGDD